MALSGRPQFAFESIGQVLDRADSESSWSASASSDDSSRNSSELGGSRPSSMKPSKRDRSRRDGRPYSVRFDDEVVMMGDVEQVVGGDEKRGKIPSPDKAVVPVQKLGELREVGPVVGPLPMSLWQLWEWQAQFTALMQMQMQFQQQQQRQQQQMFLLLPPWAVMQNPWMMGQQMTGMMMMMPMTPMQASTTTPLGSFAYCHPCFNPLTTHGVAMTAAQQTYQTTFAQQLLRYTCAGPGGRQQAMMTMMMPYGGAVGWPNPYGVPQPFPLTPAAVYGKGNLP